MTTKDTRRHYPKDPIIWSVLPNMWDTGGTLCGKRRAIDWITDSPGLISCNECLTRAIEYWTSHIKSCEALISYGSSGEISESDITKLHTAKEEAEGTVKALNERKETGVR